MRKMKCKKIKQLVSSCIAILSFFCTHSAMAAYPDKSVEIIVGFTPGGSTDLLARTLAKELSVEFNQNFIVINKPGAASNIGMTYVAHAKPDGYTLLMVPFGLPVNPYLYNDAGYDPIKSFSPIALVAKVPNVLVVNNNLPVHTFQELVAYAKQNPNKLSFSSPGVGSSPHLAGELLEYETNVSLLHVPYTGSAPSLQAVMAGVTDMAFENISSVIPQIKAGQVHALAVTSAKRSPALPDLPTISESGYEKFEITSAYGLAAPANTPPMIISSLNKVLMKILKKPEISKELSILGAISENNTPHEYTNFILNENKKWRDIIHQSGIKPIN